MTRISYSVWAQDRTGLLRDLAARVAEQGGNMEAVHTNSGNQAEIHLEVVGEFNPAELQDSLELVESVHRVVQTVAAGRIFGKRVIVMGGGAQVAQVVLGAVSEADRHNIRGERISVDTIPIVGESEIAEAVRAVARLPRAKVLVLAGSIMGGEITSAVRELRTDHGIPVISLNMVGSVVDEADLVVSDPVQAGVMAVMAIADTAKFSLARLKNRRL